MRVPKYYLLVAAGAFCLRQTLIITSPPYRLAGLQTSEGFIASLLLALAQSLATHQSPLRLAGLATNWPGSAHSCACDESLKAHDARMN